MLQRRRQVREATRAQTWTAAPALASRVMSTSHSTSLGFSRPPSKMVIKSGPSLKGCVNSDRLGPWRARRGLAQGQHQMGKL